MPRCEVDCAVVAGVAAEFRCALVIAARLSRAGTPRLCRHPSVIALRADSRGYRDDRVACILRGIKRTVLGFARLQHDGVMDRLLLVLSGPFVGSFIALVAARRGGGERVILGRSRCLSCGRVLGILELVPLVSWLVLRGRCRGCGQPIGADALVAEVAGLLIALVSALALPPPIDWIGAGLGFVLLLLALIDAREMILPDALTLPLAATGLVAAAAGLGNLVDHVLGASIGVLVFMAIARTWQSVTGREALGFGDAKLFGAAGAWVGWQGLASVLLIAAASGLAVALIRAAIEGAGSLRREIAFGPFLAAGFWLTFAFGPLART